MPGAPIGPDPSRIPLSMILKNEQDVEKEPTPTNKLNEGMKLPFLDLSQDEQRAKLVGIAVVFVMLMGFMLFVYTLEGFRSTEIMLRGGETDLATVNMDFTVETLGQARKKLHTISDESMYQFLVDHHEQNALRFGESNVVAEIIRAVEHASVREGVPLMMELFADVYKVWPFVGMPEETLESFQQVLASLNDALHGAIQAKVFDITFENTNNASIATPAIRASARKSFLQARKELGNLLKPLVVSQPPEAPSVFVVRAMLEEQSLRNLVSMMTNALLFEETAPYLKAAVDVRYARLFVTAKTVKEAILGEDVGHIMGHAEEDSGDAVPNLPGKPQSGKVSPPSLNTKKTASPSTSTPRKKTASPSSSTPRRPKTFDEITDQDLMECTKIIKVLELFVNDKPGISAALRDLVLRALDEDSNSKTSTSSSGKRVQDKEKRGIMGGGGRV